MSDQKQLGLSAATPADELAKRRFKLGSSRCNVTCPMIQRVVVAKGTRTVCRLYGVRLEERDGVSQRCAECVRQA